MELLAPAKLTVSLRITGVRDDGYHLLRSVFVRLTLHDVLEVAADPEAEGDALVIDGEMPHAADNLVLRAAARLRETIDPGLPADLFRVNTE